MKVSFSSSPDMCSLCLTRGVLLTFKAVCTSGSHERKKTNRGYRERRRDGLFTPKYNTQQLKIEDIIYIQLFFWSGWAHYLVLSLHFFYC